MFPFVKILLPYILGIILQNALPKPIPEGILWVITFICCTGGIFAVIQTPLRFPKAPEKSPSSFKSIRHGLAHLSLLLLFLTLGFFMAQLSCTIPKPAPAGEAYLSIVEEPPVAKKRTMQCPMSVIAFYANGSWTPCREKILAQVSLDTCSSSLSEGNLMVFRGRWQSIQSGSQKSSDQNAANQSLQQYAKYLLRKQITHRVYIGKTKWKKIDHNALPYIRRKAVTLRDRILRLYRENGLEEDEYAVAAALTLGNKASLDQEIRNSYAATGTAHILAISGLHTGIVYLILSKALWWLGNSQTQRRLKTALLLPCLWFFALMTGLSPSVVRASWMLSLAEIGGSLQRINNTWNYMAASAFIILTIYPPTLFDVGFQLSYLAVCFLIAFLHQPVKARQKEAQKKHPKLQKIGQLIQISGAAQAGTTPLSLYYFHQFPTFFFLTNLVVVPLSALVMYVTALLLVFHPFPLIGKAIGWLLQMLIRAMNESVFWVEKIPGATLRDIPFPAGQVCLSYIALGCIIKYHHTRNVPWLYALLTVLCIWVIL